METVRSTILVVDDTLGSLKMLVEILQAEGCQVRPANSGALALTAVSSWLPDLVLLDVRMPGMDGFEVCRQLKAQERTRDIPVIFLSAEVDQKERAEGLGLGAVDFINKPFLREELLARIDTHLELWNLHRHLAEQVAQRTQELAQRNQELTALNSLSRGVSTSLELEGVVSAGLREIYHAVRPDVVLLFQREGERLVLCGVVPEEGQKQLGQMPEHRLGECLCGQAVKLGRPLYSRDIFCDLRCTRHECKKAGYRSFAALPLRSGNEIIGMIGVASATERDFESQGGFLETLANAVAISLQNARLFAETKQAKEALEEAARHKDEFLAMLGHELRNPLAPIRNAIHLLKRNNRAEPDMVRARDMIERQVAHMVRLIDDLLDVSRISRGKIALKRENINLTEIVRLCADDHEPLVHDAGLQAQHCIPDLPLWVDGDAARLYQALSNLYANAIKFTDAGGTIGLNLSSEGNDWALISIHDTGIGISPEMLTQIFKTFSQAECSAKRSRGGLGLGLALVKGLIELHGGQVWGESRGVGLGATFKIRLPLVKQLPKSSVPETILPVKRVSLRILVIEDNLDAAESMRMLLEAEGHEVAVEHAGRAGVQRARNFRPEVILCDIGLPGEMDGYTVARELRADRDLATVYLIALTGYGQDEDRRHAEEAGFDQHLTKPADPVVLERLLARVVRNALV